MTNKSTTGIIEISDIKMFYKILNKDLFIKEINGYKYVSKFYPVPELFFSKLVNNKGLIFFEYDKCIGDNRGLLVDLFSHKNKINNEFLKILFLYKKIFLKTLKRNINNSSEIFFEDRIKSRLSVFYDDRFVQKKLDFYLNNYKIEGDLDRIFSNIKYFFSQKNSKWCVISQCDPNDLNISIKPNILDYTAGGYVPIMAEFATFFWYQFAQGNYLSLKYNKKSFKDHSDIYNKIDNVSINGKRINHEFSDMRIRFIKKYIEIVIIPCFKKFSDDDKKEWYNQFKNYLAMKILAVFDLTKMSNKDRLLSLGYLCMFYNADIKKPEDLLSIINKIR